MLLMVQAFQLKLKNSTRKLILLKLADNANDQGYCWPSYNHIAEMCEIDKRTAMRHIKVLIELGYLDKKLRPGKNGNTSNMYHLKLVESRGDKLPPPSVTGDTPLVTEDHPPSDRVSPESVNEPVKETKDIYKGLIFDKWPSKPEPLIFKDWLAHRKNKKLTTTQTVINGIAKQLHLAVEQGYSVDDCLSVVCERGWNGFKLEWMQDQGFGNKNDRNGSQDDGSEKAKKALGFIK